MAVFSEFIDIFDEAFAVNGIILLAESCLIYLFVVLLHTLMRCCKSLKSSKKHVAESNIKNEYKYGDAHVNKEDQRNLEKYFYDYLYNTYWASKHERLPQSNDRKLNVSNLKPVLRVTKTERKIHCVYSKKTLWNLAFSERLEDGNNEKFGFIFKGLKSWCVEETQGRFANVMQDLLEFRQVNSLQTTSN